MQVVTSDHEEVASRQSQFVIFSLQDAGGGLKKLGFYHRPLTQQKRKIMGYFRASGFFLLCHREMLENLSFLARRGWILISKLLY